MSEKRFPMQMAKWGVFYSGVFALVGCMADTPITHTVYRGVNREVYVLHSNETVHCAVISPAGVVRRTAQWEQGASCPVAVYLDDGAELSVKCKPGSWYWLERGKEPIELFAFTVKPTLDGLQHELDRWEKAETAEDLEQIFAGDTDSRIGVPKAREVGGNKPDSP